MLGGCCGVQKASPREESPPGPCVLMLCRVCAGVKCVPAWVSPPVLSFSRALGTQQVPSKCSGAQPVLSLSLTEAFLSSRPPTVRAPTLG